jgi:hypothetical protein
MHQRSLRVTPAMEAGFSNHAMEYLRKLQHSSMNPTSPFDRYLLTVRMHSAILTHPTFQ